jgi:hypothetical protein
MGQYAGLPWRARPSRVKGRCGVIIGIRGKPGKAGEQGRERLPRKFFPISRKSIAIQANPLCIQKNT